MKLIAQTALIIVLLLEEIGYPHAGNDVFYVKGIYQQDQIEAYIKVARQSGADIENEINTIAAIHCELAPTIIDCDDEKKHFVFLLQSKEIIASN